ncbi:hypothetical protein CEUSTIGMA_g668.t1 [Chlamydomonas eustigma]|uniref:Uncharacterized protein n=1 Tax=Chlamydomonas eustigma TaxID=1157962 RepID=A0A250WQU5_9CHLO|nr:hypothetical protein CEUSTIGMA_g668.t1 [Chlamydomonas eustigma]|eukprot:GAX73215.1 hypothetical protein CEUSTIGMA_g668.t1 [Chlamydomonas eustigma]
MLLPEQVLGALDALRSPDANLRREAVTFLEQLKRGDAHNLLMVAGALMSQQIEEVQLAGFSLLELLVKGRWKELTEDERSQISRKALQDVEEASKTISVAWATKSKVAVMLAAVTRQQGPAAYAELLPRLLNSATSSAQQAELACMVLHFLSEDMTHFDLSQGDQKRQFLAALSSSASDVFPFLCQLLEHHFMHANTARDKKDDKVTQAHKAVVSSSLAALSTWVEWTHMSKIAASNVVDACVFFLDSAEFRLQALDVLKQVVARRRTNEKASDYDGLMDKVGALLLGGCQKLGLLQPSGVLPQALSSDLDHEGSLEEFGQKLCSVLVGLGEVHFKCLSGENRRNMFLQQVIVFTRHPSLHLSSITLPLWAALLREALPHVCGGTSLSPATAEAAVKSGEALLPSGLGAVSDVASTGAAAPVIRPPTITMPKECCQALISVMMEQLPRVVLPPEETTGDFPVIMFESFSEYKDFCSNYKGFAKQIVRMATHLAPEQGLAITADALRAGFSAGTAGMKLQQSQQLEAAVMLAEASIPALTDLAAQLPAAREGLASLLQQLMVVKAPEPISMAMMARSFEAFARFLNLRPDLAAPLVSACLSTIMLMPLQEPGQAPPPVPVTSVWKKKFEARIGVCAVVVALAKAAPSSLAPYLEALVVEIQKLWDQSLIREGEKVLLWEGILAASVAAGPPMQAQILGYILAPVASQWNQPEWRQGLASTHAFANKYLPVQQQGPGSYVLGARAERWTLYHQVTLLERAFRRTLTATAPQSDTVLPPALLAAAAAAAGEGPHGTSSSAAAASCVAARFPSSSACSAHMSWILPVVAQLLKCLHGFWAPEVLTALGPLQVITEMDPVERALRLGEDRDTAKEKEEPRCVAGASMADSRYFVRGLREGCYMILSLAATYSDIASLWGNHELASMLVPALCSDLAHLDYVQLRMVHRHVLQPWALHCPPELQSVWLMPLCRVVLPSMCLRLAADWSALSSSQPLVTPEHDTSGRRASAGASPTTTDEVLTDSMLREATRDHMGFLLALTRRPTSSSAPHSSLEAVYSSTGPASGSGRRASSNGNGTLREGSISPSGAAKQLQQQPGQEASLLPAAFDLLLGDGSGAAAAEAGMRTALMGLVWPDAESAGKATGVCRYFVGLAAGQLPTLEPFVCNDLLKTALVSLAQVFTADIQAEVLGLARAIMTTFLSRPSGGNIVRRSIQDLLQVQAGVLESFEKQLLGLGSENKQRGLIKQLVAQAGNEEVKKLLSIISAPKLQPVSQKTHQMKPQQAKVASEDLLGGAIFNMIFNSQP